MNNLPLLRQLPDALSPWYAANARDLPWRHDRDPYHVWISEIMLQQTRVEAVRGYYTRFLQALPTIGDLAAVEDDRLMKLWEGLGYYNRARNLKRAAQVVMDEYAGHFPQTHGEIIALPGIGPYTAGAIASICFDLPRPAVDGNVLRVYARLMAMGECVDLPAVRQRVHHELAQAYPSSGCGAFTQALMELGATVCLPKGAPKCGDCPVAGLCRARAEGTQTQYPVKAKKKDRRLEEKTVFILRQGDCIAVEKRQDTGLLGGLWQLPNVPGILDEQAAVQQAASWGVSPLELEQSAGRRHIFTHVQWEMTGYYIQCGVQSDAFTWADARMLDQIVPLPTAFRQFID